MAANIFETTSKEIEQIDAFKKALRIFFNGDLKYNEKIEFLDYDFREDEDFLHILNSLGNRFSIDEAINIIRDIRLTAISHDKKIVFIYDNPEKFNKYRKIALENYPDIKLGFPKELWIKKCEEDNFKSALGLNLAIQDSMVDIGFTKSGYMVIRVMSDAFDWKEEGAIDRINKMVKNAKIGKFNL